MKSVIIKENKWAACTVQRSIRANDTNKCPLDIIKDKGHEAAEVESRDSFSTLCRDIINNISFLH